MLRALSSLVALLLLVGAAPPPGPAKWTVDPSKSSLTFSVNVNGQIVNGKFKAFGALIAFDPADLAHSSAKITMPMDEAKTGDATRDAMLLKPDWFNILDFPQAVFQTTSFVSKGGNRYDAVGKLTLKGAAKDVTLPFTLAITGNKAVVRGGTVLKRLDFGVGAGKDFAGETPVALSVKVMVNITATRAK